MLLLLAVWHSARGRLLAGPAVNVIVIVKVPDVIGCSSVFRNGGAFVPREVCCADAGSPRPTGRISTAKHAILRAVRHPAQVHGDCQAQYDAGKKEGRKEGVERRSPLDRGRKVRWGNAGGMFGGEMGWGGKENGYGETKTQTETKTSVTAGFVEDQDDRLVPRARLIDEDDDSESRGRRVEKYSDFGDFVVARCPSLQVQARAPLATYMQGGPGAWRARGGLQLTPRSQN
ncbi:hypothetical protein C8R47DRAFT_1244045 [Mycena vitilis]|nr:hypothetical protein C8R47DRAFT_1244045 [Mycena vitilis]